MFQRTVLVGALSPQKSGYFWKLGSLDDATNNHTSESCGTRGRRRSHYTQQEKERRRKKSGWRKEKEKEKNLENRGRCMRQG